MRECLFCPSKADSREHVWPDWLLRTVKPGGVFSRRMGSLPLVKIVDANPRTRQVCEECNRGWMSSLESECRPFLGSLVHDVGFWMDADTQRKVVRWALKTCVVFGSLNRAEGGKCYARAERHLIRQGCNVPVGVRAWIGRFAATDLGVFLANLRLGSQDAPDIQDGCLATFVIGHLILQVLRIKIPPKYEGAAINIQSGGGEWNDRLISIWPPEGTISWPPSFTFSMSGGIPARSLIDRFGRVR